MGNERLWWTWGMAANRGIEPNNTLLVYSTYDIWNSTLDQDEFNETGNISWFNENFTIAPSTPNTQDFIIQILTAVILMIITLITIVGVGQNCLYHVSPKDKHKCKGFKKVRETHHHRFHHHQQQHLSTLD